MRPFVPVSTGQSTGRCVCGSPAVDWQCLASPVSATRCRQRPLPSATPQQQSSPGQRPLSAAIHDVGLWPVSDLQAKERADGSSKVAVRPQAVRQGATERPWKPAQAAAHPSSAAARRNESSENHQRLPKPSAQCAERCAICALSPKCAARPRTPVAPRRSLFDNGVPPAQYSAPRLSPIRERELRAGKGSSP